MSIFGPAFEKIREGAGEAAEAAALGALRGAGTVIPAVGAVSTVVESARGDPRSTRFAQWLLFGGKPPDSIGPGQTDFEKFEQQYNQGAVQSQDQARDILDRLVGFNPFEQEQAQAIQSLKDEGGLSNLVDLLFPDDSLYLTPFTPEGEARFSTGSFEEFRDPYDVFDMRLAEYMNDNPGVGVAYLRETDPLSLLPVLFEQDRSQVGAEKSSRFRDIGGRLKGFAHAAFINPWMSPDRLEQAFGSAAWNDIPDTFLKYEMSGNFYELKVNGLFGGSAERDARLEVDRILGSGLENEAAANELEKYFQTTGNLGMAGMFSDLAGKIIFDPLWLLPLGAIGKGVAAPIKAATGARKLSLLTRILTPAGREVAGDQGVRALMQMPELAYAERKWALLGKGITVPLFGRTFESVASATQVEVGLKFVTAARQLDTTADLLLLSDGLNQTLRTGKATQFINERMPQLLDHPATAEYSAIVKDLNFNVIDDATIDYLKLGKEGILKGLPINEQVAFTRNNLLNRIHVTASRAGQRKWGQTPGGRLIADRAMPFNRAMQSFFATVTLNRPGFAYLNFTSNAFHMMWGALSDPISGVKAAAHALWIEGSTVLPQGGKYTQFAASKLRPFGVTPDDVESLIVRQSGARELFDIGGMSAEEVTQRLVDNTLENTQAATDLLREVAQLPAKHIGQKRRLRDVLAPFIWATSHIDMAFRRGAMLHSFNNQAKIITSASRVSTQRAIPAIEARLIDAGVDPKMARHMEGAIRDDYFGRMVGRRPTVGGEALTDADMDDIITKALTNLGETDTLMSFRSGIAYAEQFVEQRSRVAAGEAISIHTHDLRDISEYLTNELLPRLGKSAADDGLTMNQVERMLRQKVETYYDAANVVKEIGRMESTVRPVTTYSSSLRLTDEALRREMSETVDTLERFLRVQFFGDEQWRQIGATRSPAHRYYDSARQATVNNVEHLQGIKGVYDRFAGEQGLAQIAGDTIIPDEYLGDLPDALKQVRRAAPPAPTAPPKFSEDVFRGQGRSARESVFTPREAGGTGESIFSNAEYYALDEDVAKQFGPNVTKKRVELRNPLVIKNDDEYKALASDAGMEFPNPFGIGRGAGATAEQSAERQIAEFEKLRAHIRALGHDGIVLKMDPSGDMAKLLRNIFQDDQVVVFREAVGEAAAGQLPLPAAKLTVADLWDNYFAVRDESWGRFFQESRVLMEGNAPALEAITRMEDDLADTFKFHRETISGVHARAAELGDLDAAWREAAGKVQRRFVRNQQQRPALLNLPPQDPARAIEMLDAQGPLAQEVNDFAEWVLPEIRKDFADLRAGKITIGESPTAVLRSVGDEMKGRVAEIRQVGVANARAETDFAMLNYNNQYGIDHIMKLFYPFAFWPSRQAAHWGIRTARNPGAAGAVIQAINEPRQYFDQYGYPERLQTKIPLYMPWLNEMLREMPIVGERLASADFAPLYFIDPMNLLFPYKQFVGGDNFDDPERRNTPLGRVLDFSENYTPMGMNPFIKTIGAETGLLDKDAWRSYGYQGGPFGIPLTPTAREVGRWFYEGDETAVPTAEQEFYNERGYFSKGLLGRVLGLEPGKFDIYRAERALWTLATTGKLLPGKSNEEQVQAAWLALDSHSGKAWKNAVKAAESETLLRQITSWVGFPAGPVTGLNEGEMIWFGLKAAQSEAARRGNLDKFFEAYPEFEIRSAVVKGISDPEEKRAAIDTELYYESLARVVDAPFAPAVQELTDELWRLRSVEQTTAVRDQIKIINVQLAEIREQKDELRETVDNAFPYREKELSINRDPRERALSQFRSAWFDIPRESGEPFEALQARQSEFLTGLPGSVDPVLQESVWHELSKEAILLKFGYGQAITRAIESDKFDDVGKLIEERDAKLEALHIEAEKAVTQRDFLRFMGNLSRRKTPEEKLFEQADAYFDYWMSLVGSGSVLSSREKAAISAYFRSLPEMRFYFPLETTRLADLTIQQKLALMTRREFWRTWHGISDPETQLDYFYMVRPEIDAANDLLGVPRVSPIDVPPIPPEYTSDPLVGYVDIMSALNQGSALADDDTLDDEERSRLVEELARFGSEDESFGALSPASADGYLRELYGD